MSGYDHFQGMSNNALLAYEEGRKPISRVTTVDLKNHRIDISLNFAKYLADQNIWKTEEWHHSCGESFQKIKFYDLNVLKDLLDDLSKEKFTEYSNDFKKSKKTKNVEIVEQKKVRGKYTTFYKSGYRWKPWDHDFTGIKKGNWIFLDDDNGKKKANGKNITFEYIWLIF